MIITRSPLRITLGGGGTDIPAYYREHGGFCLTAAIDKYVYITLHETFEPGITLKYSEVERVREVEEIKHPIFREALRMVGIKDPHLEIASHADIPAGTGLGSSSSFTTALLQALYAYKQVILPPQALAQAACEIEIERLGEPIGKQDQYSAAFGSINALTFCADDTVEVSRLQLSTNVLCDVEDRLLIFFTGISRNASQELKSQDMSKLRTGYTELHNLLTYDSDHFALELNRQWEEKLARSPDLNPNVIVWREMGLQSGARGAKLIGAGGGGFLLFFALFKEDLRTAMHKAGLREVRFKFDHEGTKVVMQ